MLRVKLIVVVRQIHIVLYRKGGDQGKDRSPEEGHHHDPEW